MRRCKVCGEQFEALFSFCPIDGTQFGQACSEAPHSDFTLTIVSDIGLTQRLAAELKFLIEQVEQAWPSCRDQPVAFATNQLSQLRKSLSQILGRQHVLAGLMTAILLVSSIILSVLILEKHSRRVIKERDADEDRRVQKVAAVVACTIKLGLRKVVCLNPQSLRLQSQQSSRECRRHFRRRVWISIQRYGEISTTLLMVIREQNLQPLRMVRAMAGESATVMAPGSAKATDQGSDAGRTGTSVEVIRVLAAGTKEARPATIQMRLIAFTARQRSQPALACSPNLSLNTLKQLAEIRSPAR